MTELVAELVVAVKVGIVVGVVLLGLIAIAFWRLVETLREREER
jgi:hypothetical protein